MDESEELFRLEMQRLQDLREEERQADENAVVGDVQQKIVRAKNDMLVTENILEEKREDFRKANRELMRDLEDLAEFTRVECAKYMEERERRRNPGMNASTPSGKLLL